MPSNGTVKLTELMMVLRFLGITEAEDASNILSIHIDPLTVSIEMPSKDEDGRSFVTGDRSLATDTVLYKIDNDL